MIIPLMRIVPVLDLKGGVVVHARRGERDRYAPLQSPLVAGAEPVAVARALCERSGSPRLYAADLDALAGGRPDLETIQRLSEVGELWVDAGAVDAERAAGLASAGAARNVVGTESLNARPAAGDGERVAPLVLSVDLRDGRLISPRPELAGRAPEAVLALVAELGVRELLVIDLARVGSRGGPPLAAVRALASALDDVEVYAGGGVRNDADLAALHRAGAAGALVATALHDGSVSGREALRRRPRRER